MMVVVEPEDGLGVEVEECQVLILWMKHSILTFRCMPTVCSAQPTFFFSRCYQSLLIQLNLKLHPTAVAEEEVMLVNLQLQILNHILQTVLQTGGEVEVSVVEVEDILKRIFGIDIVILGLELLRTVVVVVVVEGLKNYSRTPL